MKKYIKTLMICAFVLFGIGAIVIATSYFVFYSDDLPSKLQKNHTVLVQGEVIGIDISSSYLNVTIEKGDDFRVVFDGSYEPGTTVKIEDGILKITGRYCDDIEVLGFNVSPSSQFFDPLGGKVRISVPESEYMQLVYAEVGCGSFTMKDISCGRLVTQVGAGSIRLDGVDVAFDRFLECKFGTIYNNGEMNLAINHSVSSSDI